MAMRVEHLVELAVRPVDHYYVPITVRAGPAFDRGVGRDGVRAGIRLSRVDEYDRNILLSGPHRGDGNTNRPTAPQTGSEVGMESSIEPDASDNRVRTRVNRKLVNASIPGVVPGEDTAARGRRKRVAGHLDGAAGDRHEYRQAGNSQKSHPRPIGTCRPLRELPQLGSNRGFLSLSTWRATGAQGRPSSL